MNKLYTRINWENYPSENTPINEQNLNRIDSAVDGIDDRVIQHETTKLSKLEASGDLVDWNLEENTGIITITRRNGERILFDLNIEKIPATLDLSEDGILTMTTDDGTKFTANIGAMIPVLTFKNSDTIAVFVSGEGKNKEYSFEVKGGSITEDKLRPDYLADIRLESAKAEASAIESAGYAKDSSDSATMSKSWAVGGTGVRDGEDEDNSEYYAKLSEKHAGDAKDAVEQINKKIQMTEFDVDENGYLIYTDNASYLFLVDDDGMLNWEVT